MSNFTIENLLEIYKKYEKQYGKDTYRYISNILEKAKPLHKKNLVEMTMNNLGELLRVKTLKN